MRTRNVKGAREKITSYPDLLITDPEKHRGKWKDIFNNDNPICLEIGMGKGKFIYEMARKNPNINFIGVEKFDNIIVRALEKQLEDRLPNLILARFDAENLIDYFVENEISKIFLNFSDPWPKKKHEKRRLTYRKFLDLYKKILVEKGIIEVKTDNMKLFEFSLVSVSQYGMILEEVYLNLHQNEIEDNVLTEYEEKFSRRGHPIYKLVCKFK